MSEPEKPQRQFYVTEKQLIALQQLMQEIPLKYSQQPFQLLMHVASLQEIKPTEPPTGEGTEKAPKADKEVKKEAAK